MNIEEIRDYCLEKKGVSEGFPFDETTLVFKVMGKMFCLIGLDNLSMNLKNDPEKNAALREHYPSIKPGYHMNKIHWNTIVIDGTLSGEMLKSLIDESYDLIAQSLPKKKQQELEEL